MSNLRTSDEADRVRSVYAGPLRGARSALYAWYRPEVRWGIYRLRAVSSAMLVKAGMTDLGACHALDVGCGGGGWLRTLVEWGLPPDRAHGVDLIPERVAAARSISPAGMDLRVTDGGVLPYPAGMMDIVTANTVFSSILDPAIRLRLAEDMKRVCRPALAGKAAGVIMVFDFRIKDPRNPDTVAIGKAEIRRLFPACAIEFRSLTLAPPLSRRLAPWSMPLVAALEWFVPFLRTHILAVIRPGI